MGSVQLYKTQFSSVLNDFIIPGCVSVDIQDLFSVILLLNVSLKICKLTLDLPCKVILILIPASRSTLFKKLLQLLLQSLLCWYK